MGIVANLTAQLGLFKSTRKIGHTGISLGPVDLLRSYSRHATRRVGWAERVVGKAGGQTHKIWATRKLAWCPYPAENVQKRLEHWSTVGH